MTDLPGFLVSLVTGGVAGAAVNAFVTSRKQKMEVTLSVAKDFFSLYGEIGLALGALQMQPDELTPQQLSNIRKIGDYFHYVANLKANNYINPVLDNIGIMNSIQRFSQNLTVAMTRHQELQSAWSWWPGLKGL
ncbi:hypothetical protein [Telluria aromaticivorans]|uniref:Uncharacterized protein n=1 Tax=Telluria aromaticivorans TaxID=2725995 RepID=A0A7Y2JY77_9BURK|nr:hypothetical protein [Telluria aromaticivorans]NNG23192.1 hypothetical protein [Telluria aromaticivorans]